MKRSNWINVWYIGGFANEQPFIVSVFSKVRKSYRGNNKYGPLISLPTTSFLCRTWNTPTFISPSVLFRNGTIRKKNIFIECRLNLSISAFQKEVSIERLQSQFCLALKPFSSEHRRYFVIVQQNQGCAFFSNSSSDLKKGFVGTGWYNFFPGEFD